MLHYFERGKIVARKGKEELDKPATIRLKWMNEWDKNNFHIILKGWQHFISFQDFSSFLWELNLGFTHSSNINNSNWGVLVNDAIKMLLEYLCGVILNWILRMKTLQMLEKLYNFSFYSRVLKHLYCFRTKNYKTQNNHQF